MDAPPLESDVKEIKVLFIGEIVGKSGVFCVKKLLPQLKEETGAHFVIANGEGATGGYGIGKNHAIYLRKLGIDAITSGERIYYKKDMVEHIQKAPYILRPVNYPYDNPGRGWMVYKSDVAMIGVITILGQAGFPRVHLTNPFILLPEIVKKVAERTPIIIVDFHASMSAEKRGMFYHMDGQVSAVIGTHTKALTADETILPNGTAVISDAGRTGSINSVGGLEPGIELGQFLTQIPEYSKAAWDKLELQGVLITIDKNSGKALEIKRLRIECEDEGHE
ncbi:MAG: YmdB family metallophosphoesterase [Spirochaetales bacterium]|nr:YmdB family metallophosphoesterase [Spirochaetales bacterium]